MSNINAEELVIALNTWETVIKGNAHLIARALIANGLGPVVLTANIAKDVGGAEFYGVNFEPLSQTVHSN